jgi:hypothetical protein
MSKETLNKVEEINQKNRELCLLLDEKNKKRKEERKLFLELQKKQCFISEIPDIVEFDSYNIDSPIIRGEFHILFEKNIFAFESDESIVYGKSKRPVNERNLILVSGCSDIT